MTVYRRTYISFATVARDGAMPAAPALAQSAGATPPINSLRVWRIGTRCASVADGLARELGRPVPL